MRRIGILTLIALLGGCGWLGKHRVSEDAQQQQVPSETHVDADVVQRDLTEPYLGEQR